MIKKIYIAMLLAVFAAMGGNAQDNNTNLNKEITLEKDIAPLEKKAVKKNELPRVKQPVTTGKKTQLNYSDLTSPIDVPAAIPTLLPYGYRTAHNFSDKRGYLDFGGGTQANFRMDFGYRILNSEREKLGVWLNHNSTWAGKNSTKLIDDDQLRNKQKVNDNAVGIDYGRELGNGTLTLGAQFHVDNYNYYGGWNYVHVHYPGETDYRAAFDWDKDKQTFFDFNVNAGWKSRFTLLDKPLDYNVGVQYGHAVYDKPFNYPYKHGAHDNWGILNLGGSYNINDVSTAGLNIKGEYLRRGAKSITNPDDDLFDEAGLITINPTYTVHGAMYKLQLGANVHVSMSDGAVLRLSPDVRFNLALADGFSFFANALGGKTLGYRVPTHYANHRYDSPLLMYGSIYTPLDAEAGFNIGPFQGLSGKLSLGYAIVKDQPGIAYKFTPDNDGWMAFNTGMMSTYTVVDGRGYWLGAEVNYKYRSLVEATAAVKFAPHDDELFATDKHYNNYKLGVDRASTVANLDIKVHPWRPLTFDVGLEYRGGRMALFDYYVMVDDGTYDITLQQTYTFVDMDDVINVHAGASYRLNSSVGLWLQAHNLLNRRYDILYGQGAQRIGLMGGISLTF